MKDEKLVHRIEEEESGTGRVGEWGWGGVGWGGRVVARFGVCWRVYELCSPSLIRSLGWLESTAPLVAVISSLSDFISL